MWCEAFDFTGFSQLDTKISSCLMVDYAKKKKNQQAWFTMNMSSHHTSTCHGPSWQKPWFVLAEAAADVSGRQRNGGTWGMSCPISLPVNHYRSAAAYDETSLWGISFCMAGKLVCVSVWALQPWPSFEEAGLLFCIRLQIIWHLLICVVCSNICCISELTSNHSP